MQINLNLSKPCTRFANHIEALKPQFQHLKITLKIYKIISNFRNSIQGLHDYMQPFQITSKVCGMDPSFAKMNFKL